MISAVVVLVRIAWQFLPGAIGRIVPRLGDTGGGEDWRERLVIGWSGMRGAISLAAALALPFTLDSGAPFDSRDLIVYLTVAVILVTLVGQGLTLPTLVRRLGLSATEPWAPDEAVARLATAQAALDRLDELESSGAPVPENAVARLRELYRARFARCVAALQGEGAELPIEDPLTGLRRLRGDLIETERVMLLEHAQRRPHQAGPFPPDAARPRPGRGATGDLGTSGLRIEVSDPAELAQALVDLLTRQ